MSMTSDRFFDGIMHQTHVATQSALALAIVAFGHTDRYAIALRHFGQLTLAIHDRDFDGAASRLSKIRDACGEKVTT